MTIGSNSTYEAGSGTSNTTTRLANTITNTGTLAMNSGVGGGLATSLVLTTDVTLTGGGVLTMGNAANNAVSGNNGTQRLTNAAGHTIRGSGNIGAAAMALTNQGVIVATQATPLIVQPNATGVTNTGTLRADGGTLDLRGLFTNTGGTIDATNGSIAQLTNATVVGGTLTTSAGGLLRTTPGALGVLDGVTINGIYEAGSGTSNTTTQLANTIINSGTLAMNSGVGGGLATGLVLTTDVTLTGGGVLTMGNAANNAVSGHNGTERLTNAADHTIRGSGSIGAGVMALTNRGSIIATQTTPLIVQPNAAGVTNTGVLRADGGTLDLRGLFTNTGGTIDATDGSIAQLTNATVVGGTLTTSAGGLPATTPSALGVLDGVTIGSNSTYEAGSGTSNTTTRLANTITNSGTLAMNSGVGGNPSRLCS